MIGTSSDGVRLHKKDAVGSIRLAVWCLQSDRNRDPSISVVNVMEGERSVESSLDFNTFDLSTAITIQAHHSKFVAPPVVSVLSAPR